MAKNFGKLKVHNLATIAVLGAVSSVLFLIEIPVFPAVPFYKLDLSNVPALLGAFAMGPWQGVTVVLLKALIGLTHTSTTGVGELADFLMGAAMMIPAGYIYRGCRRRVGALWGMAAGLVCATAAAAMINLWVLIPFYAWAFKMPIDAIIAMGSKLFPAVNSLERFVLLVTVPFNLIKWAVISVVTLLIYKPLSPILHEKRVSEVKKP